MNVQELIRHLHSFPDDMPVVVNGYEQGYDDLSAEQISILPIALNTGRHEWEGKHGNHDDLSADSRESAELVNALVLSRTSN